MSGWGKLEHQGADTDELQLVEVPVVSNEDCQSAYEELGDQIFESFICAGYLGVGGKDACQGSYFNSTIVKVPFSTTNLAKQFVTWKIGDSGGPARSIDGNYLAGVVSWGEGILCVLHFKMPKTRYAI